MRIWQREICDPDRLAGRTAMERTIDEVAMIRPYLIAMMLGLLSAGPLHADIEVRFVEGAPKDTFIVVNVGSCEVASATVSIDLSASSGRLIFDVTEDGAGVEVYQPLEFVRGAESLRQRPSVTDGQDQLDLQIASLAAGYGIAFTIDVDDTVGQREITVSGSEIEGAIVSYSSRTENQEAAFSSDATASMALMGC